MALGLLFERYKFERFIVCATSSDMNIVGIT